MKKIYILLASLFLFVFTGCDAILDAAYPDYAPSYDDSDPYEFSVDGLPYELNRYSDYANYYHPVVIPNGEDVSISSIQFKVHDYYYNIVPYWETSYKNYDFVDNSQWGTPPYWTDSDYMNYTTSNFVDYFEFSPNEFDYGLRDSYWDWNDYLYVAIKVIYFDGTEVEQEHTISLY